MRNSIYATFVFIALIGFSTTSQASSTEHATLCSYCQSAYQFGLHGVAALEVKQGSKSLLGRISINPITVHNPSTRKAARVTVNLATSSVSIGLVTIGVPDLSRVGFRSEFTDGSGSRESSVSLALIEKIIRDREVELNDIVDCLSSECQDLDEILDQKAEQAAKEKAQKERQRAIISEGIYDTDAFWQSGNPYGLYSLSRYSRGKGPRTIVTTESCGTEACPSWGTTEFLRSGVFAQYIRYEAPRERETIVTTYSIRGGGSGSGSGGSAVAPGGNAATQHGTEKEK